MNTVTAAAPWRQFICRACGLVYDEQAGDPDSGLVPGTRFDDIPDDWECPLCGVVKADFEPYAPIAVAASSSGTASPLAHHRRGVVIVGAGIAGWTVTETLRSHDPHLPIKLLTACDGERYHKPELSIAVSRNLDRQALVREQAADAVRRFGMRLLADTLVVGITPHLRRLRTTRGTLRYTERARPGCQCAACFHTRRNTSWATSSASARLPSILCPSDSSRGSLRATSSAAARGAPRATLASNATSGSSSVKGHHRLSLVSLFIAVYA